MGQNRDHRTRREQFVAVSQYAINQLDLLGGIQTFDSDANDAGRRFI